MSCPNIQMLDTNNSRRMRSQTNITADNSYATNLEIVGKSNWTINPTITLKAVLKVEDKEDSMSHIMIQKHIRKTTKGQNH